ncbi:MAG: M13 family metallopeptidase [Croceibacterium sp.]
MLAVTVPAAAQDAASASAPAPQMTFGTWGIDPAQLDPATKPGDDFNAYVNGKWRGANPLSGEYTRYGSFDVLAEKSTTDVEKLIADLVASQPAPGTQARRIVDAYQAYSATGAINAAGLAPAQPYLGRIKAAKNLTALAQLFPLAGYPALVSAGVTVDDEDPNSYIVSLGFSGMGLPDRDYYLVDSERNRTIQAEYRKLLTFLLGKAGYANPAATAGKVYAFENRVAQLEWARQVLRNPDLTYHKLTRAQLLALAPQYPLAQQLAAAKLGSQTRFLVPQIPPTAADSKRLKLSDQTLAGIGGGAPAMMKLLTRTDLATLKAFMIAQFLSANAGALPSDIDDARFAFYGKLLSGQDAQRPRWKRAISETANLLGEQVGALYVASYFPPVSKAAMQDLVANLRKALAASIAENTWMTAQTKAQAEAKLQAFNPKIGYPDKPKTYDGLVIRPGDALGNRIRATRWALDFERNRLGKPVDRTEWGMLPQTVNAYYNPSFNEVVFPAAILQRPFFALSSDPAVNYGGIGATIGHEMSHGFDDQGAKYDATGVLRDWWQPADLARFTELGKLLAAQYAAYCPFDEGKLCVNGPLTLGENIADNGGLSIAYRAYRMSLGGRDAPVIEGLTGDQRFFIAFAQVWRENMRESLARQYLQIDTHSPAPYRVNGTVRNQDAWYKAFNVQPGDKLYLPPEQRVHIW